MIFENGAIVIAVWPDGTGETVATFQYETNADDYCRAPRDNGGPMLIRISLHNASFRAYPPNPVGDT